MSEFIISTIQKTPHDVEICELTATITDAGILVTAKSPILADYIASKQTASYRGEDYCGSFRGLTIYGLPSRIANEINGNGIYGDMFLSSRSMDPGVPRGVTEPNIIWIRCKGLEEGVTVLFPQPAHIPADLIEYLNRSMEKIRAFYLKQVRKVSIKTTLVERVDG